MRRATGALLALICFVFVTDGHSAEDAAQRGIRFDYVSSVRCGSCHAVQFDAWSGSHHGWAMRLATADNVLGDFEDATFEHLGIMSHFRRRDDSYFVETEGPDGRMSEFLVTYVAGVEPLQQYLITLEGGRIQALSLAWDTRKKRWFHLYPDRRIAPEDGLHWTGVYQNWNARCAECHSTNFEKNYNPKTDTYRSTWAEMNVACESCHGPGGGHVEWANDSVKYDEQHIKDAGPKGFALDTAKLSAAEEVELCAACHSRRQSLMASSRQAGEPYLEGHLPALLREGLYHADGQILDEVYVYGSFAQSKMYEKGVRCTDCHDPHALATRRNDNGLCTRCHNELGNDRFPSLLASDFDSPTHHHHQTKSVGAKCVACHMPARTYMVVDPRRDHSFRVPRPDLSVELGTPNPCTTCHDDKSNEWAQARVLSWYPNGRSRAAHYGRAIATGRRDPNGAVTQLVELAKDTSHPAIVRATALDLLRSPDGANGAAVTDLLEDRNPLVRRAAITVYDGLPSRRRVAELASLLSDPVRIVRLEAARSLADASTNLLSASQSRSLQTAIAEYQSSLLAMLDFPETQMNLASLAYRLGNMRAVEAALTSAVGLDRHFGDAWLRLAEFQASLGRADAAESTLGDALEYLPEAGPLHGALGLLLIGSGRLEEGIDSLDRSSKLSPEDARVRYNLGLALDRTGETAAAENALREALRLAPSEPDILYAFAYHQLRNGRSERARVNLQRLIELRPDHPGAKELLSKIPPTDVDLVPK